jgi:hypothetical protein
MLQYVSKQPRSGVFVVARRTIRRHVNEIPRPCFSSELQFLTPPHPGLALEDVDDGFEVTVVVGAGFGVGVNVNLSIFFQLKLVLKSGKSGSYSPSPQLLRPNPSKVDRCLPVHAWCLWRVAVQGVGGDYADAGVFPAVFGRGWDFCHCW